MCSQIASVGLFAVIAILNSSLSDIFFPRTQMAGTFYNSGTVQGRKDNWHVTRFTVVGNGLVLNIRLRFF